MPEYGGEERMSKFIVSGEYDEEKEPSIQDEGEINHTDKRQLLYAHDLFGDFNDLPPNPEPVAEEVRLEDLYDPAELRRKYETELDKQIKVTNIPERMQLNPPSFPKPSVEELQEESVWIWKQRREKDQLQIIKDALQAYRTELFEIPFIYTYRKRLYKDLLSKQDLWDIYNLDRQWRYMNEQKLRLIEQITPIINQHKQFSPVLDELNAAQSLPEIEDFRAFVAFYQALVAAGKGQGLTQKLSAKQIYLEKWVQNRIPELAEKLFLRSWEFADNLKHNQLLCAPPDVKKRVREIAKDYATNNHDEDHILTAATKYAAEELSMLPSLRKFIREFYLKYAFVSTEPTSKGEVELDAFNHSYRVKRIFRRPISTFYNDLWLDIKDHEARGFIKVKIGIDDERAKELIGRLLGCYTLNVEVDEIASQCKVVREGTINQALRDYLFPYAEGQAREALTEKSQEFLLKKCAKKFKKKLMAGPYRVHNAFNEPLEWAFPKTDPGVRVLSFVVDPEVERRPTVQMAAVDQYGELQGQKVLRNLIFRNIKVLGAEDKLLYDKDIEECKNFMRDYKPDLIVVGANRLEAQSLRDRLRVLVEQRTDNDNASDSGMMHQSKGVWVAWGDLTVPKIYSTSKIAAKQMFEATPLLRMAVSQARLKQDAMSEILNLWNHSEIANDIFSYTLHPLQKLVNRKRLEETLEQIAIECVNDVGIDINKIVDHDHLHNKLAFICGLGPRKANDIILTLKKKGKLEKRIELLTALTPGLGELVYKNCIGFIKVFDQSLGNKHNSDLLDLTRAHPESYFLTSTIATDCIMDEASAAAQRDLKRVDGAALEKILRNPSLLNKFNEEKWREQLDKTNQESPKFLVDFAIQELTHPFKDPRLPHKDLSNEKLFYLLMGETKQTFYEGMIVSATVMRVNTSNSGRMGMVRCKLENGMDASIRPDDIADDYESESDIARKVVENSVIPARIKRISQVPRIEVNLTIRRSELTSHKNWIKLSEEDRKYFHIPDSDLENKRMIEEEKRRTAKYYPRRIPHKNFKNLSYGEAIEYLRNKEIGEFVFRPSSRGEDHLTLTYKFYINTYSHVDIIETDKLPGMNIGQKLYIDRESYESLDEIEARYIMPIIQFANETAGHRKFVPASSMKVIDEYLSNEYQKHSEHINYCFTILPEFPQFVILAYILQKDTIIKEYIKVKCQGYYFHSAYQKSLAALISWFKQNFSTQEYQRFLRKYNKPPTVIARNPEVHKRTNEGEWSEINKDWRNEEDKAKAFPPDNPSIDLKDDKSNTVYLPKTDYNKYNITSIKESTHNAYQGQFSTYENDPRSNQREKDESRHGGKTIRCYNCNKEGHMSRNCPEQSSRRGNRPNYRGDFRGEGRRRAMRGRGEMRSEMPQKSDSWAEVDEMQDVRMEDIPEVTNQHSSSRPQEHSYREFNTYDQRHEHSREHQRMSDTSEGHHRRSHGKGIECHNCGQEGHMARDCPQSRGSRQITSSHHQSKSGHSSWDQIRGDQGRSRGRHGESRRRSRSRSEERQPKDSWGVKASSNWKDNEGNKIDRDDEW